MRAIGAVAGCMVLLATALPAQDPGRSRPSLLKPSFARLPIYFIENRRVYPSEVAYYVQGADKTLFFTKDGITFRLDGKDKGWVVKLEFVGANPHVQPRGEDRQQAVFSYFMGPENDWKTGLRTYAKVVYEDLWPGIDLVYRGTVNQLKYEFVVKPGADLKKIRLRYRGASDVNRTKEGGLRVETPVESFQDEPPVAWQEIDGERVRVEASLSLTTANAEGGQDLGFRVGTYDPRRPLILDPAMIVYCGYIGGGSADRGLPLAIGPDGGVHFAGGTISTSSEFPVRVGPYTSHSGGPGQNDGFVGKIDPQGSLVYCGYIGGSKSDACNAIAVDAMGNAYVAGGTTSDEKSFPVTVGPGLVHQGETDAFIAKVNPAGTGIVYCGYIGGARSVSASDIAVDSAGNVYVAGNVNSDEMTFPVKVGPTLKFSRGSYDLDGFVAKVDKSGKSLVYCGYVGGTAYDICKAVAVDALGAAYTTGPTQSSQNSLPVKVGPALTYGGGTDAYIAKVTPDGSGFEYCGYIGGSGWDGSNAVALDPAGHAFVVGGTSSTETTFPVKVGPDLTFNSVGKSPMDAYVAKVAADGRSLVYCGYIGGKNPDQAWAVAVDAYGRTHVAGETRSEERSFPVVNGPDATYNDDQTQGDGFVARLAASGMSLEFCGYVGGKAKDAAYGIAVDAVGNVYLGGTTFSDEKSFPVKRGPDLTYNDWPGRSLGDAFIARIGVTWLELTGTGRTGTAVGLLLSASHGAKLVYQVGTSLGTGPISIDTRKLNLSPDTLLSVSVGGFWPSVFSGYRGLIDSNGQAKAAIHIPNITALIGVRLHTAFVTSDPAAPSGIRSISNTFSFSITK